MAAATAIRPGGVPSHLCHEHRREDERDERLALAMSSATSPNDELCAIQPIQHVAIPED